MTGTLEQRLHQALAFVDGHVRFAETKNAALLAANAALSIAILQVLLGEHRPGGWPARYLICALVCVVLAGVVTLLSFLPVTQIPWLRRPRKKDAIGNLLFFGDIQRLDRAGYAKTLAEASGLTNYTPSGLELMYAEQVIVNAKIASRKFSYFTTAIWLTLAGVLTFPAAGALLWFAADRDL